MADETIESSHERSFAIEELFFSTTDPRGFIQAGNEVFVRVSGYQPDELIGKPHSLIRHPHTPRVVFRLLWRTIEANHPIVAYVKNRAKDGNYYWVLAAVRPVPDGYLSVRLKPSTPMFAAAKAIYAELHTLEQAIEDAGGTRQKAMDAAEARLGELLHAAGFADYQAFMRTALADEVLARRAAVGQHAPQSAGSWTAASAFEIAHRLGGRLNAELDSIEEYVAVNQALAERSAALVRLAEEGQVLALNAVLAARRLGSDGGPLVAVAHLMQQTFPGVVSRARTVVERIDTTRAALQQLGFEVALAVLQNDMATIFLDEVVRNDDHEAAVELQLLIECLRRDVSEVLGTIHTVAEGLTEVAQVAGDLLRNLGQLAAIERNGRIEATRTSGAESFRSLLDNTRERVAYAQTEIRHVSSLAGHLDLGHVTSMQRALGRDLDDLHNAVVDMTHQMWTNLEPADAA